MPHQECQSCGAHLWSELSKEIGYCPDCDIPDTEENADLEDKLDALLKEEN